MVESRHKDERKKNILYLVVKNFIKNCNPISSEFLYENFELGCSSATIRNDMAELEEEGFLRHIHTSSGRVPTYKAYRYFVDFFLSRKELTPQEKDYIDRVLLSEYDLDRLLDKASRIISDITREVGVVSFLEKGGRIYTHGVRYLASCPEFQDLETMNTFLEVIDDVDLLWGLLEKFWEEERRVFIGQELGDSKLDNFSLVLQSYNVEDKSQGKLAVLGPLRMDYEKVISGLEFISDRLDDVIDRIL